MTEFQERLRISFQREWTNDSIATIVDPHRKPYKMAESCTFMNLDTSIERRNLVHNAESDIHISRNEHSTRRRPCVKISSPRPQHHSPASEQVRKPRNPLQWPDPSNNRCPKRVNLPNRPPLHPPTHPHTIPLTNGSAAGIAEGPERDVFYVVAGRYDILDTAVAYPKTYQIVEVDVRGMFVWPNGTMNRQPGTKRVANLTGAQLPNGAAFARPSASKNLMVADSYRGVIWNVDVHSGQVKVALNDASTRGGASQGPAFTGINGIKEFNGSLYWSNTGRKELWKVQVDEHGDVPKAAAPTMIMSNITCDDLIVDKNGVVYVAGPEDVITMVTPDGKQTVVAGTYGSLNSSLVGPTALRFGRGVSDQWSLYVTTNGGLPQLLGGSEPSAAGVSRIDLDP